MDLVKVVTHTWPLARSKYHYVDASRYSRVSRSKSICGLSGKKLLQPRAAYFWASRFCKKCKAKAKGLQT